MVLNRLKIKHCFKQASNSIEIYYFNNLETDESHSNNI